MFRIITLALLLTSSLFAEAELPLERESLTRRQRRALKERIATPLEGILVAPARSEEVEKPLEREDLTRTTVIEEKKNGDFENLLARLRSLFRKELKQEKQVSVKIPEAPRLRPIREPSRIRSVRPRGHKTTLPKPPTPQAQVLGFPSDHPSWLGPIPPGGRDWEKKHPVSDETSALRIRAWSRKGGGFRSFHVRINPALEDPKHNPVRYEEGSIEGKVILLPRNQIYQVEIWAGESLLPRIGYVSLSNPHHDLIGEMLPWTASKNWKPVSMMVSESRDLKQGNIDLSNWKTCLENMDLHFMGLRGPVHISSGNGHRASSIGPEDLIGWSLTTRRDRPILPWQIMNGQHGSKLQALGCFQAISSGSSSPDSWLKYLKKAHGSGGVTFLEGMQRMEQHNGQVWSPLALMLFSGELPTGVVLKDEGDWDLYLELLKKGYRLSCLRPREVRWGGQPFSGDHLLKFTEGPRQVVQSLKSGRIVAGSGVRLNFRLYDKPGGLPIAEIGDRWVPPSGNQTYQLLPKLQFELDGQSEGLKAVELWINGKKTQPTPLNRPLKRGEALFSFEGLKQGDFILAAMLLRDGRRVFSNPIYIGEDSSHRKELPVRIHLPKNWKKGFLLLRKDDGVREVELGEDAPLEVSISLLSKLEIWSEEGEVKKTTPLSVLIKTCEKSDSIPHRENPLKLLQSMEELLPLEIHWNL